MNTKLLKQKILDLAIRGKLVPQDPNDEPASVLLERIKAEKERLIAEGKIKRSKKSAQTSDKPHYENVPFEVPDGWEWTEVTSFTYDLLYGTSEKSSNEGSVPVLRMGNITRYGTIDYTDLVYSSNDDDIIKYQLQKNDLLFNRTNSSEWVGKTAIFKAKTSTIYAGYLIRVRCILLCPDYINLVMNSSYHRNWCNQVKTDAVNQSNINAQKLSKLLVPIPPYQEQLRIVKEVQRWTDVIDDLEENKQDLQDVIKQTKGKVLDLAIRGKLVPQDPTDEPASELLKRINPDAKPCDTSHYENLPDGWIAISLKETGICVLNGYAFQSKHYVKDGIKVIRITNVQDGYVCDDDPKYYPQNRTMEIDKYMLAEDDLLMSLTGNVGRVGFLPKEMTPAALNQRVGCLRGGENVIEKKYLFYYLQSDTFKQDCLSCAKGIAQLNISTEWLKRYRIMLPPFREQQRIVGKISSIFDLFETITAEL